MGIFKHEVPEDIRNASRWDDVYACFVAPDGRTWAYTDDPLHEGVSWRDFQNNPLAIAVWGENIGEDGED